MSKELLEKRIEICRKKLSLCEDLITLQSVGDGYRQGEMLASAVVGKVKNIVACCNFEYVDGTPQSVVVALTGEEIEQAKAAARARTHFIHLNAVLPMIKTELETLLKLKDSVAKITATGIRLELKNIEFVPLHVEMS